MTFEQWYRALPVLEQPQFTDRLTHCGNRYRIVYSIAVELWQLSDYKVSSQAGSLVYLHPVN